jgi:iron complex transport system permease protein
MDNADTALVDSRKAKLVLLVAVSLAAMLLASLLGTSTILPWVSGDHFDSWVTLRLSRVCNAFVVGALLGLAGVLMQHVLRNPLADPYLFGGATGAGLAQLLLLLVAPSLLVGSALFSIVASVSLTVVAFIGSLVALMSIVVLTRRFALDQTRLVLVGVAIAALLGAAMQVLLLRSNDSVLRGFYFWFLGSISSDWMPWWQALIATAVMFFASRFSKSLDALRQGPLMARNLGVNVKQATFRVLVLASIATALSVSMAGAIGFLGLAAPHLARLTFGHASRFQLAASVCIGGTLLVIADAISRSVLAPSVIPVGILTIAIGVPVMLQQLLKLSPSRFRS